MSPPTYGTRLAKDFNQVAPFYFANFGLWESPNDDYPVAARRLAYRLGYMAEIRPGARVLEIGCGLGGGLFVWSLDFGAASVTGVNPRGAQTEFAARRIAEFWDYSRTEHVELLAGSWEIISALQTGSFSHILLVDCVYHLPRHADLARECARLLRPGGKLALTNLAFPRRNQASYYWRLAPWLWLTRIPSANRREVGALADLVIAGGLRPRLAEDWSARIFPGFARFARAQALPLRVFAHLLDCLWRGGDLACEALVFEKDQ